MGNVLSCWSKERDRRAQSPDFPRPLINLETRSDVENRHSGTLNTVSDSQTELPTSSDLVIGIDFGTTFSGAAYACTAGIGRATSMAEMRRAADNVFVIKTWPNQTNYYTEKTPSVLAYSKDPPLWGGNVKPTDEPQIAYFKLGLQEDVTSLLSTSF